MSAQQTPPIEVGTTYIRVSDLAGREEKDLLSPDSAVDAAISYYQKKGIAFNEQLSRANQDINTSAFHEDTWHKRTGLMGLLRAAQRGEFQHISFFFVNRLARNLQDGFAIIGAFKKAGVKCHFLNDPIPDSSEPAHEMILASMLWAANMQSKSISGFVSAALAQKRKRGIHHGVLVAWLMRAENSKEIIFDPEWHPIYRLIVDLALAGVAMNDIADQLNAMGYRRVRGQQWSVKSLYDVLQPLYLEKMAGWDHLGMDPSARLARIFPPMITDEEHKQLMLLFHQRVDSIPSNIKNPPRMKGQRGVKLATGLIRCIACGKYFTSGGSQQKARGVVHRYVCYCGRTVTADKLEDALVRTLRQVLRQNEDMVSPEAQPKNAPLPEAKVTSEEITRKMNALLNLFLDSKVPQEIYYIKMEELEKEKVALEKQEAEDTLPSISAIIASSESKQAWRALALRVIKEATYPHDIDLKTPDKQTRTYQAVKFSLSTGDKFLAPLYRPNYQGKRILARIESAEETDEKYVVSR